MAKTDDFNVCYPRAKRLAEQLHNSQRRPEVVFGAYRPTTSIDLWDERWQKLYRNDPQNYVNGFLHYWVQLNNRILDRSVKQFGEKLFVITSIDDPRYFILGKVDIFTDRKVQTNYQFLVNWNAHPEFDLNSM